MVLSVPECFIISFYAFYTKPIHFQYVAPKSIISAKAISVSGMPDFTKSLTSKVSVP